MRISYSCVACLSRSDQGRERTSGSPTNSRREPEHTPNQTFQLTICPVIDSLAGFTLMDETWDPWPEPLELSSRDYSFSFTGRQGENLVLVLQYIFLSFTKGAKPHLHPSSSRGFSKTNCININISFTWAGNVSFQFFLDRKSLCDLKIYSEK